MNNRTRKWIRGGVEILVHGGTSALIASIVTYLQDRHAGWRMFWQSVFWQFLGNGGVRFLQYWNNNPLPPDDDDQAGKVISLSPLANPSQKLSEPTPPAGQQTTT